MQVAEAAGQVPVAEFQPQQGVHIETDPTKTDKAGSGDDASIIDGMVAQLRVIPTASEADHVLTGVRVLLAMLASKYRAQSPMAW